MEFSFHSKSISIDFYADMLECHGLLLVLRPFPYIFFAFFQNWFVEYVWCIMCRLVHLLTSLPCKKQINFEKNLHFHKFSFSNFFIFNFFHFQFFLKVMTWVIIMGKVTDATYLENHNQIRKIIAFFSKIVELLNFCLFVVFLWVLNHARNHVCTVRSKYFIHTVPDPT